MTVSDHDRRQFLRGAGQLAAAAAATTALPPAIARALAIPAHNATGTIKDVKHVVILMQENRSFDNYFGAMAGVRGFGDRFTIPLPQGRTVWEQSDGTRIVLPYHLDSSQGNAQRVSGTPHSWNDSQNAWDAGRMSEWPRYKTDHAMGYYKEAEVGFQYALANAFTVCDAYHCAIAAGTNPNRLFLWTGTNGPTGANVAAVVNEWDGIDAPTTGYSWTTYPERLQAAGVRWKVYQNMPDNFTDNSLAGFVNYRLANIQMGNNGDGSPYIPYTDAFDAINPLCKGIANTMPDGGFLRAFKDDIKNGTLPQVSWIVAPETYSEHPGPSSPIQGAWYVEQVLNALTAKPEVWSKTVLLVNFDENDGFFDHAPPPAAPALAADGTLAGASTCAVDSERFTHANPPGTTSQPQPDGRVYGMGPRVPMLVISPWSRGGWVNSQVFDHTSVIRFLEQRFGVQEPNISAWRRAVAGDLVSAFNFVDPNNEPLPPLPVLSKKGADKLRAQQEQLPQVAIPPEASQVLPTQTVGVRRSRALPYALKVDAQADAAARSIRLSFANKGSVGAVFHVYDRLHLDRLPRRYTVEAGKLLADTWATGLDRGAYDLWVLGPNGFHRHFSGDTDLARRSPSANPELEVVGRPKQATLALELKNAGNVACSFTVSANAYRNASPQTYAVPAGTQLTVVWDVSPEQGWYDLTVSAAGAGKFVRRIAGRLETGRHGISDPALGVN
ncbi:MAG TPA: phospholipase C, phosphocholine-specific [Ideonella sp.]|nr:phospholipase C, phosphocholine-specific [Ideonella sp.]